MRPPGYWWSDPKSPGLLARLLAPLGALYATATARRLAAGAGAKVEVPVICVGNLTVGGTGKTPTVIALATRLAERKIAAHVVSRGHGGRLKGPVRVDPTVHDAADVGDEPLLLAAFAPTWVSRDRAAGTRAAVRAGAGAILLDDGFQNPSLVKDLSIVVVDAETGFGNGLCLPAGPLREPVSVGLKRADLVLVIGDRQSRTRFRETWPSAMTIPTAGAALAPLQTGMDWEGLRAFAFAGIGRPSKFFATLDALGAEVVRREALDDHQPLSPALIRRFAAEAAQIGAQLVTTEKDAVRLSPALRGEVLVLPVRLAVEDWGPIDMALEQLFGEATSD